MIGGQAGGARRGRLLGGHKNALRKRAAALQWEQDIDARRPSRAAAADFILLRQIKNPMVAPLCATKQKPPYTLTHTPCPPLRTPRIGSRAADIS